MSSRTRTGQSTRTRALIVGASVLVLLGAFALGPSANAEPVTQELGAATDPSPASPPAVVAGPSTPATFTMVDANDPQIYWWTASDFTSPCANGDGDCAAKLEQTGKVNAIKAIAGTNGGKWPDGHAITPPRDLVINGDLTAYNHPGQHDDYRKYYVDGLPNMNVIPGLGNHDYANNVHDPTISDSGCYHVFPPSYGNDCAQAAVDWMRFNVVGGGEPNFPAYKIESWDRSSLAYSWTQGNYRFIQLNNYPMYNRPEIGISPSVPWLKRELARAKAEGKPVVLNVHEDLLTCEIPHLATGAGHNNSADLCTDEATRTAMQNDLRNAIADSTVVTIFRGHVIVDCATAETIVGKVDDLQAGAKTVPVFQAGHSGVCPQSRDKVLLVEYAPDAITVATVDTANGVPTFYKPNVSRFVTTVPVPAFNDPGARSGFVAVGVPREDLAGDDAGAVDIHYRSSVSTHTSQLTEGNTTGYTPKGGDQHGYAMASGDFNNDGLPDLATGAPMDDDGGNDAGIVTVTQATTTGLNGPLTVVRQSTTGSFDEANDRFGSALASGDFNHDGYDDLAVGTLGEDVNGCGNDNGAITVVPGSANGLVPGSAKTIDQTNITGASCNGDDRMGAALATGDLNGDGFADLVVGLPGKDLPGANNAGAVRVFTGAADGIVATRSAQITQTSTGVASSETEDQFGTAVAVGDFNGDGKDDLIVGVPYEDVPSCGDDSGEIDVVMGSSAWPTISSAKAMTQGGAECQTDDRMGSALAAADFNKDGRAEAAVGIPGEDTNGLSNAGRILVLNGSSTGLDFLDKSAFTEASISGRAPVQTDQFGYALAAGDANADGVADLAIGVPGGDVDGQSDAGWVHVVPGGPSGLVPSGRETYRQALLPGRTCSGPSPRSGAACAPDAGVVDDGVDGVDFSGFSVAMAPVLRLPSAPGTPTLTFNGNLNATWAPATATDGAIDGYAIDVDDLEMPGDVNYTNPVGTTPSISLAGASAGHHYRAKVRAHSPVGWGSDSAWSNTVLAAGPPSAPTAVTGTPGDGQVSVSWTASGSDGGSPITTYTATSNPEGKTCTWTSGPASCTVTGLTNGTAYTFTVVATNASGDGPPSAPSAPVIPAKVPGAPTSAVATPGDGQATVTWVAPADDGGSAINSYLVTSSPGGLTCSVTGPPLTCPVTGLANGTPYTFTVTATNGAGTGPPSAPTASVTPISGSYFHPLAPKRILDTRSTVGGWKPVVAGTPASLNVTSGGSGVPAGAKAVVANVTATGGTAASFLTVYPTGGAVPNASNLNFAAGQTIPNLVTVKVGAGDSISFANAVGQADVVVDIVGYYDQVPADRYDPLAPTRILDSRTSNGGWGAKLPAGAPRGLQVRGVGGVPATADAVIMNVTVTGGTANSFLTVFPGGGSVPTASNVNFAVGQTIPNLVTVKLGADGTVAFSNAIGAVHVIADVVGFYDATQGDVFHAIDPSRVLDSRTAAGGWNAKLVAGVPRTLAVGGTVPIDGSATAVIGNSTVTEGTANSFLTVYPAGQSLPVASNVNFAAGETIPNLTAVKLGTNGQISFANNTGAVHVIFDAVGYFTPN